MAALGLFDYYIITISFSIAFILAVSLFLYSKRKGPAAGGQVRTSVRTTLANFTFICVLTALLVFYIVTVYIRSYMLFAIGNIVVELLLVYYVMKNRSIH
ncbi:MAG: hypothetical protein ABSG92_02080 [Conexivisphaerales archaeon]